MTKTLKTKVNALFPRRRSRESGGARLDLLLPRDWLQTEIPGAPGAPILWRWRARLGETQTGQGTLEELPNVGSAPVHVWTPATETLLTRITLPTRSRAKLEQALPYALEEQLLDDPAELHFAWRRENDGSLSVAVTAKERIRNWLASLQKAGLKPATFCPAILALPWSPDCWSAAFVGDELLVRTGPASGFTCMHSIDEPPTLLAANLKQTQQSARAPEYFIVFQPPVGFRADAWSATLGVPVRVEPQAFWDVPGDSEPALNLLQGEFAPGGELRQRLRPWLPAAAMFALWFVGTVTFDTVEWWRLHQLHTEYAREMNSLLLSAFPETKTILDPAQQMQRGFDALQARAGLRAHDLLPLLGRAAPAWQSEPRARLRALRYGERSLTLEIVAPDTQALEGFQRAVQANGLQTDILATTPRAGGMEARLRIQASAAVSSAKP